MRVYYSHDILLASISIYTRSTYYINIQVRRVSRSITELVGEAGRRPQIHDTTQPPYSDTFEGGQTINLAFDQSEVTPVSCI